MEVKEVIKFINNGIDLSTRDLEKEYLEKMDGIIALLKSLESENKKLKKENEELKADRKWHHLPKMKHLGGGE